MGRDGAGALALFPRSFRATLSSIGVPALQAGLTALGQNVPRGERPVFDPRRSEADRQLSTQPRRTVSSEFYYECQDVAVLAVSLAAPYRAIWPFVRNNTGG